MQPSVTLNAEQSSALQNAYFVIAKKDQEKDGMYDLVALSSAISNDGTGKLTADWQLQNMHSVKQKIVQHLM